MSEVGALKKSQERLLDLYLSEDIDKDTYLLRKVSYDAKIEELQALISKETDNVKYSANDTTALQESLARYDELSRKEKRFLLEYLIKSVIVDGEKVIINLRLSE